MRLLVCGGRNFDDFGRLNRQLDALARAQENLTIIHGGARGADTMAGNWANRWGHAVLVFRADWNKYGDRAGPIRNQRMLDEGKPDIVVAFPGGRGTADMVRRAQKAGVKVVLSI